jgi:hypothetical protein
MKWFWAISITLAGLVSAQAYTCADVRALSLEQRAYYIKVFKITTAQQERIRRACNARSVREAEMSTPLEFAGAERDRGVGR